MKENKVTANIAVSIFSGAVGTFVALLLVIFAGYTFLDLSFLPASSCSKDDGLVYCFFDENWDSGTYLSVVTGFYSTIITILIALLGVVAALAYIVIRGSAFQRAEEAIEKEVDRYFERSSTEEKIHLALGKIEDARINRIEQSIEEIEIAITEAGFEIRKRLERDDEKKTKQTN